MRRIESSKRHFFFFKINTALLHHSNTPVFSFRKFLPPIILAFVFIFIANTAFSTVAAGQKPLTIKVGAYANPPKIFMNADGKVSGFWPDLVEHIAKTENWKIEYIWGTWSDGLHRLREKEIDIMPDVAFTEIRSKLYAFSEDPVLMSWTRLYINKENTEIKSMLDLKNKKIAALKGSVNLEGPGGLREITCGFNLNCAFLELDNYTEVFKAVEESRADAGITNRNFGDKYAKNFEVKMTPIIFQPMNMKFAFPQDARLTPHLMKRIDHHMKQLIQDGSSLYYRLLQKHFEAEIAEKTVEVYPRWLSNVLKSIAALFIIFILVMIVSRIQVKRKTIEIMSKNEALLERKQFIESIVNLSPDILYIYDIIERKNVYSNDGIQRVLGYSVEEIQEMGNQLLFTLMHPDDFKIHIEETYPKYSKVKDNEAIFHQYRMKHKNGRWHWLDCSEIIYLRQPNGSPKQIFGVVHDITERKNAEALILKERDQAQQYLDIAGVMLAVLDEKGKVTLINKKGCQILGYDESEILHKNWFDLCIHEDIRGEVEGVFNKLMAGDTAAIEYFENAVVAKSGDQRIIAFHNTLIRNEESRSTGALFSGEDVTEHRQMEEKLKKYYENLEELVQERTGEIEDAQKALLNLLEDVNEAKNELEAANEKLKELDRLKSMFIASMSHELRTPLNSIIGFTGIILQGMSGEINDEQTDQLRRVYGSGKHLLALITDIIDISKIEAGKVEIYTEEFDVAGVIKEAISSLRPEMDNKGLGLGTSLPRDVKLNTDRKRLLQCVLNYLSNAVKFTEKGKIEITAHEVGATVGLMPRDERTRDEETSVVLGSEATDHPPSIVISVADTGIGIKEEDMPKLFKSFVRLDTPLKTTVQGTGLGLYVTKKLVTEVLGGEVFVDSTYGEGSVFGLRIPREI